MMKDEDFLNITQGLNTFYGMYEFFYEKTDGNIKVALELTRIWWYGINQGGKK